MGVLQWLSSKEDFSRRNFDIDEIKVVAEPQIKELAIQASVNLIASSISRARFKTYRNGKPYKGQTFYLFNVQANPNQNATEFTRNLVSKLLIDNQALAIMYQGSLYNVDSWEQRDLKSGARTYAKIRIGEFTFQDRIFQEKEVLNFRLNNEKVKLILDELYESYGKLIRLSMSNYYKKNSRKYFMHLDTLHSQVNEDVEEMISAMGEQFKKFFGSDGDAIWPVQKGVRLEPADKSVESAKIDSREIRNLIDDVFDYVSMAFNIPKGILKGDIADVEAMTDNLLTFCINPIAERLKDEINRKMYTPSNYMRGTRLEIDTRFIKDVDITKLATAADKLLRTGTHSMDDNRDMLGLEPLDTSFSKKHFITKNYDQVSDAVNSKSRNGSIGKLR